MKRICIFGASITWGAFDKKGGGWIHRLNSNFINKKTDIQIYNLGVPGNNTNDLLKRFDNECSARKPDLIIFGLGGNDASYIDTENNMVVSIDQFKNNILKLIQQGKYFTDKIIAKYDSIINTTCNEMGILFLPMIDLLDIDDLSNDGRHPNDNGYQKISNCVRDYLYKNNLI
jgi:lysophospholipase L1-like esterase